MKRIPTLLILGLTVTAAVFAADPPYWAWGFTSAPAPVPVAGGRGASGGRGGSGAGAAARPAVTMLHLEGSKLEFPSTRINDSYEPVDWFPDEHPPMPDIVAHGRRPDVRACALCHNPDGQGRSENATVDGYTTSYFLQTMADFAAGNRKTSDSRKTNTAAMATIAKNMTPDELKAAAAYFGSIPFRPWIKIVETTTVPKTRVNNGLLLKLEGNEKEALGNRIVEVADDAELTEDYRSPHSAYTAYVPVGAVKKGQALAVAGQCATCHGADLRGIGPVPTLAGRSPSYMMRQLWDMEQGNRKGEWTSLMLPVIRKLSTDDMLNLVAYAASLKP